MKNFASSHKKFQTHLKKKGVLCRNLDGHGHWVNSLALNSDYIIRTGAFDPKDATLIKSDSNLTSAHIVEILILNIHN